MASFPVSTPSYFFACSKKKMHVHVVKKKYYRLCEQKAGVETGNKAKIDIHTQERLDHICGVCMCVCV